MKKFLWQQIPDQTVSEIMCRYPEFAGVVLDTEHGVFNDETLFNCIQIITLCGKECFVRLTEASLTRVRYCLDAGANGLIFSTVEEQRYVSKIINQCVFPKVLADGGKCQINYGGRRGYGLTRDNFWGEKTRSIKPIIVAQIETKLGCDYVFNSMSGGYVNKLDFFDYFMIGPYDLSSSLGCPGDFNNKIYNKYVNDLEKQIGKDKIGYHIVKDIASQYEKYKNFGFLAFSLDTIMLLDGQRNIIENIKT